MIADKIRVSNTLIIGHSINTKEKTANSMTLEKLIKAKRKRSSAPLIQSKEDKKGTLSPKNIACR